MAKELYQTRNRMSADIKRNKRNKDNHMKKKLYKQRFLAHADMHCVCIVNSSNNNINSKTKERPENIE